MDKTYKGHIFMALTYLLFGLNIPIVKYVAGVAGITGLSITFYRMAGGALLFWVASLFVPREKVPPRDVLLLLGASIFGLFLNQLPFVVGISLTSPIDAGVITTIGPMITMVMAAIFLREPITWMKAGGVAVGMAGALVLILSSAAAAGRNGASIAGDLLCAASSLSFALYLTLFKRLIGRYSPVTLMRWMFLFATLMSLPVCWRDVAAVDYGSLDGSVWAGIGFIVVGATFLTYIMLPVGQRHLRPTVLSMYNYMQPTVAAVVAVAAGMDTFGATKGLATLLVFAGVWLVTRSRSRADVEARR